jgi:sulfate transport system ATP-binding protein
VVVMNHGKVEQIGSPAAIYDHPATAFVASFIGSSNRLEGRIAEGGKAELEGFGVELGGVGGDLLDGAAANGGTVDAYVRPHDVELRLHAPRHSGAIPADVVRIIRLGWIVKIELKLESGRTLTVQQTKDQIDELGIQPGDGVYLTVRGAKVFPQGYSI